VLSEELANNLDRGLGQIVGPDQGNLAQMRESSARGFLPDLSAVKLVLWQRRWDPAWIFSESFVPLQLPEAVGSCSADVKEGRLGCFIGD
jgi:hypothetical protein